MRMELVTACYWQKETPAELFLSLQQRKYRRLGISVVCACISDNGELVRSLQNKMEEELEEENVWRPFREEILQEKWMDIIRQQKQDDSYAGILCVGSRVLFFSHGRSWTVDVFRDSAGHNGGRCRNPHGGRSGTGDGHVDGGQWGS